MGRCDYELRRAQGRGLSAHSTGRLHSLARGARKGQTVLKCSVRLQLKLLRKILRTAAYHNIAKGRVNLAVSLVYYCPLELKKTVKGCGGLPEGRIL